MVARFVSGKNIEGMVRYNEQKVASGKAELIQAAGYTKDLSQLSFSDKMGRFKKLITMNGRVVTNAVHISLNFDPSENLADQQLREIAQRYMEKIGFETQPFLVYRHDDAGHPHVHIVSTNIKAGGERIPLHNIGRLKSEPARKEIEQAYGLIKAEGSILGSNVRQARQPLSRIVYGQQPTKAAIAGIVQEVVRTFRFTSMAEFNAVLQHYGILADRGSEHCTMHRHKGLQYCIMDQLGNKLGVPVKASSLPGKPTLSKLEKLFVQNEPGRHLFKAVLKKIVDQALHEALRQQKPLAVVLDKHQVCLIPRRNKDGLLYGVTFVDTGNRTVFNGSDLGKEYSAQALLKRLAASQADLSTHTEHDKGHHVIGAKDATTSPTELLLAPEVQQQESAAGFKKKKRKKRIAKRL